MQKPFAVLTTAFLLFILFQAGVYAQAEVVQFEFREVLTIGDDESAPAEYLFTNPEHIRTDTDGRIYVADRREQRVRVFSAEGEFLGALGREGKGPGEFTQINAMAFGSEGQLVVYDRMQQRFTRFPPFEEIDTLPLLDSDRIDSFPNPEEYMFSPDFMYGLPDGRFVLFYHPLDDRSPAQPRFHVYDERFEKVGAFGAPREWPLPKDEFTDLLVRRFGVFAGSHSASDAPSILLAPWTYDGTLYRYAPDDGTWAFQHLEGKDPGHPTHEVVFHEERSPGSPSTSRDGRPDPPVRTLNSTLENGTRVRSVARPRSTSRGVGQLSDGRVVHLSMNDNDEGVPQLQLELFGAGGTLRKVGPIERFEHDKTGTQEALRATAVSLQWVDRRDRLYLVEFRSGFPVLRIVELVE